jgi:hypothetical protein
MIIDVTRLEMSRQSIEIAADMTAFLAVPKIVAPSSATKPGSGGSRIAPSCTGCENENQHWMGRPEIVALL